LSGALTARGLAPLPILASAPCALVLGPVPGPRVDHVTLYRWVQRFTPLLVDAARPYGHAVGDRWYVDDTYVKLAGRWRYVYRAIERTLRRRQRRVGSARARDRSCSEP